jgi:competence protein ComEA
MDFSEATEKANVWLYRVQQRLAITRSEAAALVTLAALLLAGMVIERVNEGAPQAVPGSERAATDHRFQQAADRLRAAQEEEAETRESGNADASNKEERPPLTASSGAAVNLNAASEAQLERLPGVGPVIAERIAAYRREHGPFAQAEHLERVSGIGPKTLAQLAPLVSVAAPPKEEELPEKAAPGRADSSQ